MQDVFAVVPGIEVPVPRSGTVASISFGGVLDMVPGVSNVKGVIEGDWQQAALGAMDPNSYSAALDAAGVSLGDVGQTLGTSIDFQAQPFQTSGIPGAYVGQIAQARVPTQTAAPVSVGDFGAAQAQKLGLGSRAAESQALNLARDAALGLAPSAAQAQLQQGLDAAERSALSIANSARGGAAAQAAALRQGQSGLADLQVQAARDAAQLRAAETAAGRQLYGTLAGSQRAGDLGLLQSARGFGLGEAGLQRDISLGNLEAGVTREQQELDRQNMALQGALGVEQLAAETFFKPQELELERKKAEAQARAALAGGALNAAGGVLGIL